ncbi:hypothetical protein GALMADRAFT_234766 [Galerina marginata CBS 339.88]|uniref:Uncharacterized protein n=1 Tax=Galerina marginata (strain CBS 339.88) TaxID=685588 RepID=A0A067TR61_GALM3|nr:hypothetical protein GALMADRAFT_234766 [Galerina marginata CBS 339.88]
MFNEQTPATPKTSPAIVEKRPSGGRSMPDPNDAFSPPSMPENSKEEKRSLDDKNSRIITNHDARSLFERLEMESAGRQSNSVVKPLDPGLHEGERSTRVGDINSTENHRVFCVVAQ